MYSPSLDLYLPKRKPLSRVQLYRGDPVSRGLMGFWGPGPFLYEWLSGNTATLTGSAVPNGVTAAGPALHVPDTTSGASWPMGTAWRSALTNDFTIVVQANIASWGSSSGWLFAVPSGPYSECLCGLWKFSSDVGISLYYAPGAFSSQRFISSETAPTGLHTWAVTRAGGTLTHFRDGVQINQSTGNSTGFDTNTDSSSGWVELSTRAQNTYDITTVTGVAGDFIYAGLWNRPLNPAEITQQYLTPYRQFREAPQSQAWFFMASGVAGGGTTPITATDSATVAEGSIGNRIGGQYALERPTADTSAGLWTPSSGGTLFGMLNETTADASTFDSSSSAPAGDTFEVSLGNAPVAIDLSGMPGVLNYQYQGTVTGGRRIDLTVVLLCNGTPVQTWTLPAIQSTFLIAPLQLSSAGIAAIVPGGALSLRTTATQI